MNIENISALSRSLQEMGFENIIDYQLLRNAIFKPANFTVRQRIVKGNDVLNFYLAFEKNRDGKTYSCLYYEAVLRKEIEIPDISVNDVQIKVLDKKMTAIDWIAFESNEKKKIEFEDKATWIEEEKIEDIVTDLLALESNIDGKEIADRLKIKHWCDISGQDIITGVSSLRSKFEISQRFYIIEDQVAISVEEAYRFLHNRWMEKQLQAKKKQADITEPEEQWNDNEKAASNKSLVKKKRKNKSIKIKSL